MLYELQNKSYTMFARYAESLSPLPHIHQHLELIYIEKGSTVATLDNQEYTLNAGDCFLTFPNQIHFYHDQSPLHAYLAIFSSDYCKDLKKLFCTKTPGCPVVNSSQFSINLKQTFQNICNHYSSVSPYGKVIAEGELTIFLGEMLPHLSLKDVPVNLDSTKNVLIYCFENYLNPITLEAIAKELHLNRIYVSRIFNERLHTSFSDFINTLRVNHACSLLKKEEAYITDVAFASGFSSIRSFNRAFLKYKHISPSEYVKLHN